MTRRDGGAAEQEARWRRTLRRLGEAAVTWDLGDESVYLAEELVAQAWSLGERERIALALLVLALAAAERQGSTRLPLAGEALSRPVGQIVRAAGLEVDPARVCRDIRALAADRRPGFVSLIGRPGEDRPLVADGDAVASHRLWRCEERLAAALRARLAAPPAAGAQEIAGALADVLARPARRGGADVILSDEQRAAVELAAARALAVISGGPGTGKTAICASLCRVLVRAGVAPGAIALCAPTGKAAQRLTTSVRAALAAVAEPAPEDERLAAGLAEARTLHRLLGHDPDSGRFRHHARAPLPAEVVVVDEASMVDLALMERLVRALGDRTRLVLFGDADQLPSVEAGAVLRDLVACGEAAGAARRLSHSYRMDGSDPAGRAVLEAARAVRAGRAGPARRRGDRTGGGEAAAGPRAEELPLPRFVDGWFREHIAGGGRWAALAARTVRIAGDGAPAELGELFALIDRARVLAVTRRMPAGTAALNDLFHRRAAAELGAPARADLLPGEPVIVRENDYGRGLFNGDAGVVVRAQRPGGAPEMRAAFPAGSAWRTFPLAALRPRLDRAFALTVHQSQGSEYDHVALVLPPADLPLCTRELVYTALTRARRSARVIGSQKVLRAAVARTVERHSGLAQALVAGP